MLKYNALNHISELFIRLYIHTVTSHELLICQFIGICSVIYEDEETDWVMEALEDHANHQHDTSPAQQSWF